MTSKEFALQAIRPYFKNPDMIPHIRCHHHPNGYKSVIATYVKRPVNMLHDADYPYHIIGAYIDQKDIMVEEAMNMLSVQQWDNIFFLEKAIGANDDKRIQHFIRRIGLFSYEELQG